MRVVKEAEVRRNEILDAAAELFGNLGFDKTTTNDILKKVGIARGTLYYHFKSKEDIMDALINRYCTQMLEQAKRVATDKAIPVGERIIRTILALNISNYDHAEVIEHIHKPQNALMHQKTQSVLLTKVPGILTPILEEGIKEGIYNTPYPYECMEMIMAYTNAVFDQEMVTITEEERARRIEALIFNIERLLGAESKSLGDILQIFQQ